MKKLLASSLLFLLPYALQAADLAKNDSTRTEILKAIHADKDHELTPGTKFDVRRAWASKKFAYMCGLYMGKDGYYEMTDDQYDQAQIILIKKTNGWTPVLNMETFATSPRKVSCLPEQGTELNDEYLKQELKNRGISY